MTSMEPLFQLACSSFGSVGAGSKPRRRGGGGIGIVSFILLILFFSWRISSILSKNSSVERKCHSLQDTVGTGTRVPVSKTWV
mmetsp:Transcript_1832/g.4006  ORF Transcript_1832/g.4006 Transcript_1832/m.4006 type:complete len:83 (-) Transcript_1832:172-420(-)